MGLNEEAGAWAPGDSTECLNHSCVVWPQVDGRVRQDCESKSPLETRWLLEEEDYALLLILSLAVG